MMSEAPPFRVAATSDIHYSRSSKGQCAELFAQASHSADLLLLCGDLTDYGLPEEAHVLAEDLHAHCRIPVVGILGNHDFEAAQEHEVSRILEAAGVRMLDGECFETHGIGIVGVCGFGGGFGRRMLNAWGEPAIKKFVQEAVDQALKLERGLARLQTPQRIAMLHYAPIPETIEGENPEIFAFLGSTRLEGPLNRHKVTVAFHGHAHNGSHLGHTSEGIPVYNVAVPLLKRDDPSSPGFIVYELPATAPTPKSSHVVQPASA